jgi:hypothetical protein
MILDRCVIYVCSFSTFIETDQFSRNMICTLHHQKPRFSRTFQFPTTDNNDKADAQTCEAEAVLTSLNVCPKIMHVI